jgi:hypothetical protein
MSCTVFVLVEGYTELRFIKTVLDPSLSKSGIVLTPIVYETERNENGSAYRGGGLVYARVGKQIAKLLASCQSGRGYVSTMFDYYKLPSSFPGASVASSTTISASQRVRSIESAFLTDIEAQYPHAVVQGRHLFLPFIMLHEFETLLFVDPVITAQQLGDPDQSRQLARTCLEFNNQPEEIDHITSPSQRIKQLFSNYDKSTAGPLIVQEIGIPSLRTLCPHFGAWVAQLEGLGR